MTRHLLDARGLKCPWPALRLARVMRQIAPGDSIHMIVTDPKAGSEIASLAQANGWRLDGSEDLDGSGDRGGGVFTIFR